MPLNVRTSGPRLLVVACLAARGESRVALEADLFRQLCVAEPRNIPDIPSVRRLDLTKNLSLPAQPDFHHGLPALGIPSQSSAQLRGGLGKKVYISVDMEGISGISGDDQLSATGAEYGRSRKLMAEDTNAAIRGALASGATDILVNDSHGGQRNLLPEDLNPWARLISHSFKRHGTMEGLGESFSAIIFVGYHAQADNPAGLFAHTGSGVVRDLEIDGRSERAE